MRAGSVIASSTRHVVGMALQAFLIAAIVAALVIAAATAAGTGPAGANSVFAARGGNGGGGSSGGYSISVVGATGFAATAITYGSVVATNSSYGDADPAYARVACYANKSTDTGLALGSLVYDVFRVIRQGAWNTDGSASFDTTASRAWTGGGADCTASLMTYSMHNADRVWKKLASTTFSVLP